jgi:hypothetical protein
MLILDERDSIIRLIIVTYLTQCEATHELEKQTMGYWKKPSTFTRSRTTRVNLVERNLEVHLSGSLYEIMYSTSKGAYWIFILYI